MCTVTIIRGSLGGVRVVTSRDESPRRAAAEPPTWHTLRSGGRAMWPVDPTGGGTWIAAADHGLCLAILNCNPRVRPTLPPRDDLASRGSIIPALIERDGSEAAMEALGAMDLRRFGPFRLIAIDALHEDLGIIEARWDYESLAMVRHACAPLCFASSGLGDHLVEPRLDLFERMVVSAGATDASQDAFHAHRWPDRPEISVLMRRAEARTVSICAMSIGKHTNGSVRIDVTYTPVEDEPRVPDVKVAQARTHSGHRP